MLSNFKRLSLAVILIIITSMSFVGCSYFFDKKEKETQVELKTEAGGCLSETGPVFSNYFKNYSNNQLARTQIVSLGDCYKESVDAFVKFTKGGDSEKEFDHFSIEKLKAFFDRFYPELKITQNTIRGYLDIKQFLLGGKKESISRDEMRKISTLIPSISQLLGELAPYRSLILEGHHAERTPEGKKELRRAFSQLKASFGSFFVLFKPWMADRSIDIVRLGQFIINEYHSDDSEEVQPKAEALVRFKNLTLNEKNRFLGRRDLETFIYQTIKAYEAIVEFNTFIKTEDDSFETPLFNNIGHMVSFVVNIRSLLDEAQSFKGEKLSSMVKIYENFHDVLSVSAQRGQESYLSTDLVGDFFEGLEKAGYLAGPLTAKTLTVFLKNFVNRWAITSRKDVGPHLDTEKLSYIHNIFNGWEKRQTLINSELAEKENTDLGALKSLAGKDASLIRWLKLFSKTAVHQWTVGSGVQYSSLVDELSYEDLSVSNALYTLVSVFVRPYTDKRYVDDGGVTKEQAQEVYEALRILGVEMKFVDARVTNTGEKAFLEGNNFSTQKKNDDVLDFYEAYEILSVLFSTGIVADNIHKDIPTQYLLSYKDVLQSKVVDIDRYVDLLDTILLEHFTHFKNFYPFWKKQDDLNREKFLGALRIASRAGNINTKPVDLGEIRTLVGTLYYLESVFHNFDKNGDGVVHNEEIFEAEEHFRSLVIDYILKTQQGTISILQRIFNFVPNFFDGGKTGEEQMVSWAPAIFMYILREGKVPDTKLGALDFFSSRNTWKFEAKRMKADSNYVLRVFSALAETAGKGHVSSIREFLKSEKEELLKDIFDEEAPDCSIKKKIPYCRWAHILYCTDAVKPQFYEWMRSNERAIFPKKEWEDDFDQAVERSIYRMSQSLRVHKIYSVQCAFPHFEDPDVSYLDQLLDGADETINGDESSKGLLDNLKDLDFNIFN